MARIGVLALQGGFEAQARMVRSIGHEAILLRSAAQFEGLEGLILPGGESTTQLRLLRDEGLDRALDHFVRASGAPLLATCAGLILAAREVRCPSQESFGWIDATVSRNAWGRQVHSFEARADRSGRPLVFIRAPRIEALGAEVELLETFEGEPVMIRQGNVWAATFHPELTSDDSLHRMIFG